MLSSYELNDSDYKIFSKLKFKEKIEINIPQKSREMQLSVNRIVYNMLNGMKAKAVQEEDNKVPKKPTKIYKRRTDRNNLQNSKKLISMKTTKISSNDLKRNKPLKNLFSIKNSSIEKLDKTNLSFGQLTHGQSFIHSSSIKKTPSKAKTLHVKNASGASRASEEDKRRERVIKRLGCTDDRFVESLMMNTDKSFNVHKFLDVNMYQILRGKKREPHELKLHRSREHNLARIKENAAIEGEDLISDFSINEDIDYITSKYKKGCMRIKSLCETSSKLNPFDLKDNLPVADTNGSKTERKEEQLFNKKIKKKNQNLNLDLPLINQEKQKFITTSDNNNTLFKKFRKNSMSNSSSKPNAPIENIQINNEISKDINSSENMVIKTCHTNRNSESLHFNFNKLDLEGDNSDLLPVKKNSIFLKSSRDENNTPLNIQNDNLLERSKGILKKPSILKFNEVYKTKNSINFPTSDRDNCNHDHRVTKSVVFKNK